MLWHHVSSSTHGIFVKSGRGGGRWSRWSPSPVGDKNMFPALLCSICCGAIPSDRHLQLTLIITDQPLAPLTSRFYRWKPFPPPFTLSVGGKPPFPRVTSPLLCRTRQFPLPRGQFDRLECDRRNLVGLGKRRSAKVVQIEEVRSPVGSNLVQQRRRHHISVINVVEEDH